MTTLYQDEGLTVYLNELGFVEWVAKENHSITINEVKIVNRMLAERGRTRGKALINRENRYIHPEDYMIYDMSEVEGVRAEKVAYYAPTTRDQIFSHVVALTALHNVTTRVFDNRDEAVAWLLDESATEPPTSDAR